MTQYVLIFIAGVAGSFHCVGMCGGFACMLGSDARGAAATLRRHLIYNAGRVTTYVFLGALAGALGTALVGQPGDGDPIGIAQRVFALVSGLLMVFIGLQFFGYLQRAHGTVLGLGGQFAVQSFQSVLKAPGPGAPLTFGVLNGFLPCPLVYAFLAQATALSLAEPGRGVATGVFTMAAFGLGTFPAMLLMGWLGRVLRPAWRRRGVWAAGAFIVALGLVTIVRGALPLGGHLVHAAHAHDPKAPTAAFELRSGVGGPFSLIDHTGRSVTEADFRGSFLLVYFGYTFCPDVCPTELSKLGAALTSLGVVADEVQPVFISVDPARDTVDVLAAYVNHFHPRLVGLTGSPEQVARVATAYGVRSSHTQKFESEAEGVQYFVNHSVLSFLMGPDGRHLETFLSGTSPEAMAARIRRHVELEFVKGFLLRSPELSQAFEAFAAGDYGAAFQAYRAFAEQGNPTAQNNLGVMYEVGSGVPEDAAEALAWYRRAAERGSAMGQYNLGIVYGTGPETLRDVVRSYAWLAVAEARGLDIATAAREAMAGRMTPAQIAEGERLADAWGLSAR